MATEMLNVTEAKTIILEHAKFLPPVNIALSRAAGMVLAEDVYATINIPAYAQSSMDGYAFSFADLKTNKPLRIEGVIAAGSNETGFYHRIMRYAFLPVPRYRLVPIQW